MPKTVREFKQGDATDGLANHNLLFVEIYQTKVKRAVRFKAMLTKFSDSYDTSYDQELFGGETETAYVMENINRKIDIGWDIIAASAEEAEENMQRCSGLFQLLYPKLERDIDFGEERGVDILKPTSAGDASFRIRFLNLVGAAPSAIGPADETGLFGYLDNVSYDVQPEMGFFRSGLKVFPKYVKFDCTFYPTNPVTPPGWIPSTDDSSGFKFSIKNYPYGVGTKFSYKRNSGVDNDSGDQSDNRLEELKQAKIRQLIERYS